MSANNALHRTQESATRFECALTRAGELKRYAP